MERGQLDCGASFTLVRQENGGPASARNTGARLAQGSLLVFTDDDCEPDEDWLTRVAAANRRAPEAALGGRCINGLADNSYSTASQMLIDYLYAYDGCGPEGARFFTSNNFAVPAASFAALGGSIHGFRKPRARTAISASAGGTPVRPCFMFPTPLSCIRTTSVYAASGSSTATMGALHIDFIAAAPNGCSSPCVLSRCDFISGSSLSRGGAHRRRARWR
jgi:hypothetical protein